MGIKGGRLGQLLVAGVVAVAGVGAWTVLRSERSGGSDGQVKVTRELNDSLIYLGIGLFQKQDFAGAISAWQRYIEAAPPNADTVSVREMIQEAESAATKRPAPRARRTRPRRLARGFHPAVLQRVDRNRSVDAPGTTESST